MSRMSLATWLAYLLLSFGPAAGLAQVPAAPRIAVLIIWVEQPGSARVTLDVYHQPHDESLLQDALATALGCPLTNVRTHEAGESSWTLRADCPGAFPRRGLAAEGTIDLRPLRQAGIEHLNVQVFLPQPGFARCQGAQPLPQVGAGRPAAGGPLGASSPLRGVAAIFATRSPVAYRGYVLDMGPDAPDPPLLEAAFGYTPPEVLRLTPLGLVLLLPAAVALWLRRRARRSIGADPAALWYACWEFQRCVVLATFCLWLLGAALLPVGKIICFLLLGTGEGPGFVGTVALALLPPAVAVLLGKLLAVPLFDRLPGLGWTRGQLVRQALWGQATWLPVMLAVAGVGALMNEEHRSAGLWFCLAAVSFVVCATMAAGAKGLGQKHLPPGALRDRILELADNHDVRVRQVVLLPPTRWRLVNVFAAPGPTLHLTAELLPHLSQRETDALVAHELAHLLIRR